MSRISHITTQDGHVIARDEATGRTATGRSLPEALAELRRLLSERTAQAA